MEAALKAYKTRELPGLCNKVMLPDVDSFDELFEGAAKIDDLGRYKSTAAHTFTVNDPYSKPRRGKPRTGRATISSYMSVSGQGVRESFDVKLKPAAVEAVREHMMLMPDYVINYEVHLWEDGLALVAAHYNQITGSRWIAVIDAATVPR